MLFSPWPSTGTARQLVLLYVGLFKLRLHLPQGQAEHELYVVLGPLVSKPVAIAASHKLLRWLRKEQPTLFFAPVAK